MLFCNDLGNSEYTTLMPTTFAARTQNFAALQPERKRMIDTYSGTIQGTLLHEFHHLYFTSSHNCVFLNLLKMRLHLLVRAFFGCR